MINTISKHKTKLIAFLLLLFCLVPQVKSQFYNGTQVGFGKNRVQYDYFEWKYYRFAQYETYFYTGGQELAIYTAKVAKEYIKQQEEFFEVPCIGGTMDRFPFLCNANILHDSV